MKNFLEDNCNKKILHLYLAKIPKIEQIYMTGWSNENEYCSKSYYILIPKENQKNINLEGIFPCMNSNVFRGYFILIVLFTLGSIITFVMGINAWLFLYLTWLLQILLMLKV